MRWQKLVPDAVAASLELTSYDHHHVRSLGEALECVNGLTYGLETVFTPGGSDAMDVVEPKDEGSKRLHMVCEHLQGQHRRIDIAQPAVTLYGEQLLEGCRNARLGACGQRVPPAADHEVRVIAQLHGDNRAPCRLGRALRQYRKHAPRIRPELATVRCVKELLDDPRVAGDEGQRHGGLAAARPGPDDIESASDQGTDRLVQHPPSP